LPADRPDVATIDPTFAALPLSPIADAALAAAQAEGAGHADVRVERIKDSTIRIRDRHVEGAADSETVGLCVRVLLDGTWGFAASAG